MGKILVLDFGGQNNQLIARRVGNAMCTVKSRYIYSLWTR